TTRSVEIVAPLELVYDALARFEDLPEFIEGVEDVRLADETHMRLWFGEHDVAAEITEQRPFERIAWHAAVSGSITFERVDAVRTRVTVNLDLDGHSDGRLQGDLDRFKAVAEARAR